MLLSKSRYKNTRRFDEATQDGESSGLFTGLRARPIAKSTGVIEHVLRAGDRLDHLARHYYNDDRLWWRILDANPHLLHGAEIFPVTDGSEIRNPDSTDEEISEAISNELVGDVILIPMAKEV